MSADKKWPNFAYRECIRDNLYQAVQKVNINSNDMENYIFSQARNEDEYLKSVAQFIVQVRELGSNKINSLKSSNGHPQDLLENIAHCQSGVSDSSNELQNVEKHRKLIKQFSITLDQPNRRVDCCTPNKVPKNLSPDSS